MELNFIKSGDNIVLNLPTDGIIDNEFFQGSSLSNTIKITFTYETTSEDATVSIFPTLKLIRPDNIKIGPRTYDPASFETEIDGTNTILSWEFTLQEMDLAVDGVAWFAFPFSYRATSTSANTIKSTGAVSTTIHKSVIVENTAIIYDDADIPTVIANLLTSITNVVADLAGNYYTKAQTIRKYEVTDTTGNTNLLALFDTLTIPGTYYINWYVDENNVVYSVKLDITAGENTIFRQTATYQSTYNGYATTTIMTRSQDLDISDWTEPFTTRYELYDSERNKVGYVNEDGTIDYVNTAISFAAKCDEAITRGDALQITGTTGTHITVKKAVYSEIVENPHLLIGIAEQSASTNDEIKVKMFGLLEGLDTSSYSDGLVELFLSTTVAGGITETKPENGYIAFSLGMVFRKHITQGAIAIAINYDTIADKTYNFDSLTELITWQDSLETAGVYYGVLEEKDVFRYIVEITSTGNIRQVREQFTNAGEAYGYDFPATMVQQRTFAPGESSTAIWSKVLASQPNVYIGDWDTLEKPGIYFAPTFLNGRYDMTYLQVGQRIGDPLDTKIYQIAFSWHPQREVVIWLFREFEPGMGSGVAWSNEKWLAETPLQVSGVPTTATKGYYIGQLCVNTTTSDTYILLGWNGENSYTSTEFTWVQVALGSYLPLTGGTILNDLVIGGNLTVNGTTTTVNTTNIEIADKLIVIAKNNTVALTTPAGILAKKYDGTNDGALVFDNTGTAKVGDVVLDVNGNIDVANSDLQTLATRSEIIVNGNLVEFDTTLNKIVDSGKKISDYLPINGGTMTDNINMGSNSLTYVSSITDSSNIESPLNRYYDIAGLTVDLNADYLPIYDFKGEYILQCKNTLGGSLITNGPNANGNFRIIRKVVRSVSSTRYSIHDTYVNANDTVSNIIYTRTGYYTGTWSWSTWYANFTTQAGSTQPLTGDLYINKGSSNGAIYIGSSPVLSDSGTGNRILAGSGTGKSVYLRPNGDSDATGVLAGSGIFKPEVAQGITLGDATYPFGATHHGALSIYDSTGALTNVIPAKTSTLYSTVLGVGALAVSTNTHNTAIGYYSGFNLTTGTINTIIGSLAGQKLTASNNNTIIGCDALSNATSSSHDNIIIGYKTGKYISGGSTANTLINQSVLIGRDAYPLASGDTNEIVVGYNAIGHGSNTATWGNTSITDHYMQGNLHITGQLSQSDSGWQNLSLTTVTAVSGLTPQYRKIGNTVYLRGAITNIATNPLTFSSLPSGYRPTMEHLFYAVDKMQATPPVSISIDTSGNIVVVNGDADSTYNFYISTSFLID